MYLINQPFAAAKALSPLTPLRLIRERRQLFIHLIKNNLSSKFRKSKLGVLWLFIPQLCMLFLYVYVFSYIFKMKWPEHTIGSRWSFGLTIYTGITVYTVVSDTVMGSISALSGRVNYLKKIPFPVELLPVSLAVSNFVIALAVLAITGILAVLSGSAFNLQSLWLVPVVFPLLLLACGCAWVSSIMGVFFRDIGNLFGILLLFLFFTAPIFYSIQTVPENLRWIAWSNPLTPFVINVRNILLFNGAVDWKIFGFSLLYGIAVFQGGFFFFSLTRRKLADVI